MINWAEEDRGMRKQWVADATQCPASEIIVLLSACCLSKVLLACVHFVDMDCTGMPLAPTKGADATPPEQLYSFDEPNKTAPHANRAAGRHAGYRRTNKSRGLWLPAQGQDGEEHLLPTEQQTDAQASSKREKCRKLMLPTQKQGGPWFMLPTEQRT